MRVPDTVEDKGDRHDLGSAGRPALRQEGVADMIVCAPVTKEGMIDPRWGKADWVALADVVDGEIVSWQDLEVSWSRLHDEGTPGSHHARVVTFLREHHVEAVVANHMGDGMVRMLDTMGLPVHMGAAGDAREAVRAAIGS
jgi:predicted Fe-Mo cluster-binding NifX family protein